MAVPADPQHLESQRKFSILLATSSLAILALCLVLRLVPSLNDALSGPPLYMRAISTKLAQQIANATGGGIPILVMEDESQHCEPLNAIGSLGDETNVFYLLTYSETQSSNCLTTFIKSAEEPPSANA